MLRISALLVSFLAILLTAGAQDDTPPLAKPLRIGLEPPAPVELDDLCFGGLRPGMLLAPEHSLRLAGAVGPVTGKSRDVTLGGVTIQVELVDDELRVTLPGEKRPMTLRKAKTLELATLTGVASLRFTPYEALIPGATISDGGKRGSGRDQLTMTHWRVHRLEARRMYLGDTTLVLLDADLNDRFTDFGTDLVILPGTRAPLRLSQVMRIEGELYRVEAGEENTLEFKPYEGKTGMLDPFTGCAGPARPEVVVVTRSQGGEFLIDAGEQEATLPVGQYRLRHALMSQELEVLAPDIDPSGRGRATGGKFAEPWAEVADGELARPKWGGPFRLHPVGSGFVDPVNPSGGHSSSVSGGLRTFEIDTLLVRGTANEIWDEQRKGPVARLAWVGSFGETSCTIGTLKSGGKRGRSERWVFSKAGSYTSRGAAASTVSFTVTLEPQIIGKLEIEVPIGR